MNNDIVSIRERVNFVVKERSALSREIEFLLRKNISDSESALLEEMIEQIGGYITRPWGSEEMIVKLTTGE